MAKVYISSTYSDLIEERSAAVKAVLRLRQHAIAMEHYVASDQRPLEKCVADVQASDIYVGIIGWRYGFIPEGQTKSITHLELEAAGQANVPRLIFLRHDDTKTDMGEPEEIAQKLHQLRQWLSSELLINFFTSAAELEALVTAAVSNTLADMNTRSASPARAGAVVPQLLPYLADRSEQELEIRNGWHRFVEDNSGKPFVLLSHGGEDEAHDWFLERLCEVSLPRLVAGQKEGVSLEKHLVKWPPRNLDVADSPTYFCEMISERLTGIAATDMELLCQQFTSRSPLLLHSLLLSEDWQYQGREFLESYLQFWNTVPDLPADCNRPLFTLICIQYQNSEGAGFFERRRINNINRQIRDFISGLAAADYPGIHLQVLSELAAVQQQDAEEWVHLEAVGEWCNAPALLQDIRNLYREQKRSGPGGQIPMEDLGFALEEMIKNHKLA